MLKLQSKQASPTVFVRVSGRFSSESMHCQNDCLPIPNYRETVPNGFRCIFYIVSTAIINGLLAMVCSLLAVARLVAGATPIRSSLSSGADGRYQLTNGCVVRHLPGSDAVVLVTLAAGTVSSRNFSRYSTSKRSAWCGSQCAQGLHHQIMYTNTSSISYYLLCR